MRIEGDWVIAENRADRLRFLRVQAGDEFSYPDQFDGHRDWHLMVPGEEGFSLYSDADFDGLENRRPLKLCSQELITPPSTEADHFI